MLAYIYDDDAVLPSAYDWMQKLEVGERPGNEANHWAYP